MSGKKVHIIGGGIMGLMTAFYLYEEGCEVHLIDAGDMTDGTSFGNAGMIVPSHFIPMAAPGVIRQGLSYMLKKDSPFSIQPSLDPSMLQWLWKFAKIANKNHVKKSMPLLWELNTASKNLYADIVDKLSMDCGYENKGLLMLYKTEKQYEVERAYAQKAKELGVEATLYNTQELKELEPSLKLDVKGGIYFPDDAHYYPNRFIQQLQAYLKDKIHFHPNTSISHFNTLPHKIQSVISEKNEIFNVDYLVITAGSWTTKLLRELGEKIYIQAGKGYSLTQKNTDKKPSIPTILTEAKVAITPMMEDFRITGTMEIGKINHRINHYKLKAITDSINNYYPELSADYPTPTNTWIGFRPCSFDGLPYIAKLRKFTNACIGTGHGMMGLSLGAITGKLLSELIVEKKTSLPIDSFGINR